MDVNAGALREEFRQCTIAPRSLRDDARGGSKIHVSRAQSTSFARDVLVPLPFHFMPEAGQTPEGKRPA